MTRTIWKYPLAVEGQQTLTIRSKHQVLSVQAQHGVPCIWAAVDPDSPDMKKTVLRYETGQPIENDKIDSYIGTVQVGDSVLHYFFGK